MPCLVDLADDNTNLVLNGPITRERLVNMIESTFDGDGAAEIEDNTRCLLGQLSSLSSRHKFLANVLRFSRGGVDSNDVHIDNFTGFSWNEESDGTFYHKLEKNDHILIISIFWISL